MAFEPCRSAATTATTVEAGEAASLAADLIEVADLIELADAIGTEGSNELWAAEEG